MPTPVLSVITVCFNAKAELEKTMENVLLQTWKQFEYLVIDGGSADGTAALLKDFSDRYARAGIPFRCLSEADEGIYDAMNKGTKLAEGAWLLFLNAGDLLADPLTLARIFSDASGLSDRSGAQIVYGDTFCTYQGNRKLYPALPLEHLLYEMSFCHQSAFIKRELLLEQPYDITYKIGADHHFFLSMYLRKKAFDYRPLPVSVYEIAGYSDTHKAAAHRELHRMQRELGVLCPSLSWLRREIRFWLAQGVKSIFGQKLTDLIRRRRLR